MEKIVRGRCWRFGDYFPTDLITPKERLSDPFPEMAKHIFETYDPDIARNITRGDILVGGKMFGCSSSRIAPVKLLNYIGIGVVVAESIARIFYRNCISLAIPVIECKGIAEIVSTNDRLEVDITTGDIRNLTTGAGLKGTPVPEHAVRIIEKGGIVPFLKEKGVLE